MSTTIASESTPVSSDPLTLEQRLMTRGRSLSPDILTHPRSAKELYCVIMHVLDEINAGERIRVTIPRNFSHDDNNDSEYDWDNIEDVQMDIRGGRLRPNVFASLRFEETDESDAVGDVVVDIVHV